MRVSRAIAITCLLLACDGDPAAPDGSAADAATADAGCTSAAACDDGRFCTGVEACDPGAPLADADGCVRGPAPCGAAERCDETRDACVPVDCGAAADADGDGHDDIACGADDCDDLDPNRFPGHVEVCDVDDHDEDCDASTFGVRDADGDGFADASCCNVDEDGTRRCGVDCDDLHGGVHPGEAEVCNTIDDDCDGAIDELVTVQVWPDRDFDGFGDGTGTMRPACYPLLGESDRTGDCDDGAPGVHPGAAERCTEPAVDEDCDGVASPPALCECTGTASRPCGLPGACAAGVQRCLSGTWSVCSIRGSAEACDGVDDDCDGVTDEGTAIRCFADVDDDGFAAAGAALAMRCWAAGRDTRGGCPEETTAREPSAPAAIDCDDADPAVRPGAAERCDGTEDDDCDGLVDEGTDRATCHLDADRDGFAAAGAAGALVCSPPDTDCPVGATSIAPSASTTDCNDADPLASPGNVEACNGRDDDCDGTIDEGLPRVSRFRDDDRDGYGGAAVSACDGTPGTAAAGGDCNDTDYRASPGQLSYFSTPHCPPTGPCTYDWNCDGAETLRPALVCTPQLMCALFGCAVERGFRYTGGETCGGTAQRASCTCTPPSPQACRANAVWELDPTDPKVLVPVVAPAECR